MSSKALGSGIQGLELCGSCLRAYGEVRGQILGTMTVSPSASWGLTLQNFPPEPWANFSPELFLPPVLSIIPSPKPHEGSPLTPRCQTNSTLRGQPRGSSSPSTRRAAPCRTEASTQSSASQQPAGRLVYWCEAAPGGVMVQKQSPQMEIRMWGKWGRDGDIPQGSGHWAVGPPGSRGVFSKGGGARSPGVPADLSPGVLPQLLCPVLCSS